MSYRSDIRRRAHRRRFTKGITLIEMLVSVLILSACMALVSGVAFQVSKVLQTSQAHDRSNLNRFMLHHQVLDVALQRLVVGRDSDRLGLTGDEAQMAWITSIDPFAAVSAQQAMRLVIVQSGESSQVRVSTDGTAPTVVLEAPRGVRWRYLDEVGAPHSSWPPLGATEPAKAPNAIVLEDPNQRVFAQWTLRGPKRAHPALSGGPGSFAGGVSR